MSNGLIVKQKNKLHNRFDVFKKNVKTGKEEQVAYAENIILDGLWSNLITSSVAFFTAIHVGTGSGILDPARTSLFTFLFGINGGTPTYESGEGWHSARRSITITETQYVGSVLTEIGIASNATTGNLRSHALLKDMNGNPVSIEKTDTDILTFYATVYLVYSSTGWENGMITYTSDPTLLGIDTSLASTMTFKQCLQFPLGNVSSTIVRTNDTANKKITAYARLGAASGNYSTGISSAAIDTLLIDLSKHSGITGNTIAGEQVGVGDGVVQDFVTEFPFVRTGAVVKVDGVVQSSGVTVDIGVPNSEIAPFMINKGGNAIDSSSRYYGGDVFENPFYQTIGIFAFTAGSTSGLRASDDNVNWVASGYPVSAGNRNKRYWKYTNTSYMAAGISSLTSEDRLTNIHFDTAPAVGAVVTIDYTTDVVQKNANHVFDLTIVREFAEYTP